MKKLFVLVIIFALILSPIGFAQDEGSNDAPAPPPEEPAPEPEPAVVNEPEPVDEPEPILDSPDAPVSDGTVSNDNDFIHDPESIPDQPFPEPVTFPEPNACGPAPFPMQCGSNERLETRFDNNGCISGYDCIGTEDRGQPFECSNTVACISGDGCCPQGCSADNDKDCNFGGQPSFNPKPPKNLPEGCWFETDEYGGEHVECNHEPKCLGQEQTKAQGDKCAREGGTPVGRVDARGCGFVDCEFKFQKNERGFFESYERCPLKDEIEEVMQSCKRQGMDGTFVKEGGCNIPVCREYEEVICPTHEDWERMSAECAEQGLEVIKLVDQNGCNKPICGDKMMEEIPEDAYLGCDKKGGELVIRRDNSGEVKFIDCVRKGDEKDIRVGYSDEVPDTTKLLSIALRLEDMKIQIDKLKDKTKDIALYWEGKGNENAKTQANRMNRVSGMFAAVEGKVNDISSLLKEVAKTQDPDVMLDVNHEFQYLKEVMLNDILFYMLSSDEEAMTFTVGEEGEGCGTDGGCFDSAYRACKQTVFFPEGTSGTRIEIKGLEGSDCILFAEMPEDQSPPAGSGGIYPPYTMTCKIQNYAQGMRSPEDIIDYCDGPMAQLMKKFGFEEGQGTPGVPGKCQGDGCRSYCGRGPAEAQECLDNMKDFMPPDVIESLSMIASGEDPGFSSQANKEFKDDFRNDFGKSNPCGDGICDDFETRNPGECVMDCPWQQKEDYQQRNIREEVGQKLIQQPQAPMKDFIPETPDFNNEFIPETPDETVTTEIPETSTESETSAETTSSETSIESSGGESSGNDAGEISGGDNTEIV